VCRKRRKPVEVRGKAFPLLKTQKKPEINPVQTVNDGKVGENAISKPLPRKTPR
jgi:hypothetical protein